jgi:hypothetical protein
VLAQHRRGEADEQVAATSLGRNTARRQWPTPSMTPGWVSIGSTPARASEDLPPPLMPSTSTKARPPAAWRRSRSSTSPIALVRPKKIGACS